MSKLQQKYNQVSMLTKVANTLYDGVSVSFSLLLAFIDCFYKLALLLGVFFAGVIVYKVFPITFYRIFDAILPVIMLLGYCVYYLLIIALILCLSYVLIYVIRLLIKEKIKKEESIQKDNLILELQTKLKRKRK